MFGRCKHEWEPVTDKVLESACEQVGDWQRLKKISGPEASKFFEKTSITILKCTKCGKINKTIVRSI